MTGLLTTGRGDRRSARPATRLLSLSVVRAWARRQAWRAVLTLTGGVTVEGALPAGACVVVANHSSHADTAALLAAIPARRRPVVVAASDYWLGGGRLRRAVCRGLVEIVPVRRGGGGSADLALAGQALADGRAVVVFPEGTRSRDGRIGEFHCGAFRLASEHDVPAVPVGLTGTREVLPAHGELGVATVGVRIGGAMPAPSPEQARRAVISLAEGGTGPADSVIRARLAALAGSRLGLAVVAGWAAAEAFSWPVVPEVLVGVLVLALPRRAPVLALTALAASTLSGVVALLLAGAGWSAPEPLVTPRMSVQVDREIAASGAAAVRHQPTSGIPLKAYAAAAGRAHVAPVPFALNSLQGRGVRMVVISGLLALVGAAGRRLRRFYPFLVGTGLLVFAVGLGLVVRSWS